MTEQITTERANEIAMNLRHEHHWQEGAEDIEALAKERDELENWRIAVEQLTPGGSEYHRNLSKCLEYLQNAHEQRQRMKSRLVEDLQTAQNQLKQVTEERDRFHAALEYFFL